MNNRLTIALHNPCKFAGERTKKLYALNLRIANCDVQTVITVDHFGGSAEWHISAQVIKNSRPVNLFARLSRAEARSVAEYLQNLLSHVGSGDVRQKNSVTEFHFHKSLSAAERALLKN